MDLVQVDELCKCLEERHHTTRSKKHQTQKHELPQTEQTDNTQKKCENLIQEQQQHIIAQEQRLLAQGQRYNEQIERLRDQSNKNTAVADAERIEQSKKHEVEKLKQTENCHERLAEKDREIRNLVNNFVDHLPERPIKSTNALEPA
jgi:hypothetical protein